MRLSVDKANYKHQTCLPNLSKVEKGGSKTLMDYVYDATPGRVIFGRILKQKGCLKSRD